MALVTWQWNMSSLSGSAMTGAARRRVARLRRGKAATLRCEGGDIGGSKGSSGDDGGSYGRGS